MVLPVIMTISVVLFVAVVIRYLKIRDFENIIETVPSLIGVWIGLVALLALIVRLHAIRIYELGIGGRNFWGIAVRFKWSDIRGWRQDKSSGIAAVVLIERESGREMWIIRDLFFSAPFQDHFQRYVKHPV